MVYQPLTQPKQAKTFSLPQLRLGSTSFVTHQDYVNGVRYAAKHCADVALLLNCVGAKGEWLIKKQEVLDIAAILKHEGASLHVHLPTEAHFDTKNDATMVYDRVLMALDRVALLHAHSFVLHIEMPSLRYTKKQPSAQQIEYIHVVLQDIARNMQSPDQLAVENIEGYPTSFWDDFFDQQPYSRCLDVGHIWKDGLNPAPVLENWFERVRIIHLHGLAAMPTAAFKQSIKDHVSLAQMPEPWIDDIMHPLWRKQFSGVLCLEVFDPKHLALSHEILWQSWLRYEALTTNHNHL